jgi:hypothetical protein
VNLRLGRWSRLLAPGYGSCFRCKTPWRFIHVHLTPYAVVMLDEAVPVPLGRLVGSAPACFPLCEKCWEDLGDPSARLPYYRHLWDCWVAMSSKEPAELAALDRDWAAIRDAVLAGG